VSLLTTLYFNSAEAQEDWGARLASALTAGVIFLEGDLGAGKTTLARGLLRGLGHEGRVKSPTYTLVESYQLAGRQLHHWDLYRLADPEELLFLGMEDLCDGKSLLLIEWPEKGEGMLPPVDLSIRIDYRHGGRQLLLQPMSLQGEGWLEAISKG
jgi:tRNA threonylcarbamoyladenosine biosynthesis protein TsaE